FEIAIGLDEAPPEYVAACEVTPVQHGGAIDAQRTLDPGDGRCDAVSLQQESNATLLATGLAPAIAVCEAQSLRGGLAGLDPLAPLDETILSTEVPEVVGTLECGCGAGRNLRPARGAFDLSVDCLLGQAQAGVKFASGRYAWLGGTLVHAGARRRSAPEFDRAPQRR